MLKKKLKPTVPKKRKVVNSRHSWKKNPRQEVIINMIGITVIVEVECTDHMFIAAKMVLIITAL